MKKKLSILFCIASILVSTNIFALDPVKDLFPLVISISNGEQLIPGQVVNIFNGPGDGHFGWLTWNQKKSDDNYLEKEINNPRLYLKDYVNPMNPKDHNLNINDWVKSMTNQRKNNVVLCLLDNMKEQYIRVLVYDKFDSKTSSYHIVHVALVRIIGYNKSYEDLGLLKIDAVFFKFEDEILQ